MQRLLPDGWFPEASLSLDSYLRNFDIDPVAALWTGGLVVGTFKPVVSINQRVGAADLKLFGGVYLIREDIVLRPRGGVPPMTYRLGMRGDPSWERPTVYFGDDEVIGAALRYVDPQTPLYSSFERWVGGER